MHCGVWSEFMEVRVLCCRLTLQRTGPAEPEESPFRRAESLQELRLQRPPAARTALVVLQNRRILHRLNTRNEK